jgi:hypothetical protein
MAKKTTKKVAKKTTKKTTKKVAKKTTKKVVKKQVKCLPENHSKNPALDKYVGFEFYWSEPWDFDAEEEESARANGLVDEDGEILGELSGTWRVDSVHECGEMAWVSFVECDGDYQMEFPLCLIPDPDA